jgi:hypothetical protein
MMSFLFFYLCISSIKAAKPKFFYSHLQTKKELTMKKIILIAVVFAFVANVSAQLKVNSTRQVGVGTATPQYKLDIIGNTRVAGDFYLGSTSNLIATINNVPITFKVNGVLSGYTGNLGMENVSFGYKALYSNIANFRNTANGYSEDIPGDYNTASGVFALSPNITGNNNTAIGANANVNANNLSNVTAIGAGALATASNQVRIGDNNVTSIGGYAAWTNLSDKRAKKNIQTDVPGLDFINRLQPVTYNLDLDALDGLLNNDETRKQIEDKLPQKLKDINKKMRKRDKEASEANKKAREAKEKQLQTGFIAQDVEAAAKSIGYDFSGVDVDETGIYGLRYAEFVVPLVKAVQELSAQVNELTELVSSLQEKDASAALPKSESATKAVASGASLRQNIPNPFNQSTTIHYTLPQEYSSAQLVVSNTAGQVVRQIPLPGSDTTGSITIEGGALLAGTYYYSLYVDGKLVDTKQMVLTK